METADQSFAMSMANEQFDIASNTISFDLSISQHDPTPIEIHFSYAVIEPGASSGFDI